MNSTANAGELLDVSIGKLRAQLRGYEQPSEVLTLETLRAIDYVFCRELFADAADPNAPSEQELLIMSWGTNQALRRILPGHRNATHFRNFPSTERTRLLTDDFVLSCGSLAMAERLSAMLQERLVQASVQPVDREHAAFSDFENILVVTGQDRTLYSEVIGRKGLSWLSAQASTVDRPWEEDLERRHRTILPELDRRVNVLQGWAMSYTSTKEIDAYFLEWGQLYLRRMTGQDMIGLDERLGENAYNEYLGILALLTGRAQKHLCYVSLLKHRHPHLSLRNLLTGFARVDGLVTWIAEQVDGEVRSISRLLDHLTLQSENVALHTLRGDTAWAPTVRASDSFLILPMYGLEINPFLFLLNELRARYEKDWFRAANNREKRWIAELESMFPATRWHTNGRNLKLRYGKNVATDIDFAVWDELNNELGIFQLKWQQPVGLDNRARRSAGSNLVVEGNRWVQTVIAWLDSHGAHELAQRLGFTVSTSPAIRLFVVARYHAYFSGFGDHDSRAVWSDWSHFIKIRVENTGESLSGLTTLLEAEIAAARPSTNHESYSFPLPEMAVVVNPIKVPRNAPNTSATKIDQRRDA